LIAIFTELDMIWPSTEELEAVSDGLIESPTTL